MWVKAKKLEVMVPRPCCVFLVTEGRGGVALDVVEKCGKAAVQVCLFIDLF
jgi:hypothetical protein